MSDNLADKLTEEFPFMRRRPLTFSYGMYGCECGDGWYELLRGMCAEITKLCAGSGVGVGFTPLQIKEKMGTLRVYYTCHSSMPGELKEKITGIVHKYQDMSATVCIVCGQPGVLRKDLCWILTLCDTHYRAQVQRYYTREIPDIERINK